MKARLLLIGCLLLVLLTRLAAQPTYRLDVRKDLAPRATLSLKGTTLTRSAVADDPGFRLQFHFQKAGKTLDGFDICPTVPVVIGDDLQECAAPVRAYASLYVGGMGSREKNFYNRLAVRMGYEEAAAEVQDKYLARDYAGAAAAVPFDFIDKTSLIGPRDRIRERLQAYADAGVGTLTLAIYAGSLQERLETVRTMAEILRESGLAR